MAILITGIAGFIGFHVAQSLISRDFEVVGLDDLNDYYDPALKRARLNVLSEYKGLSFHQADVSDMDALQQVAQSKRIDSVIHLAAQAGVRYSLENPNAYVQSNLVGHSNILELCRHSDRISKLIYASSSSVYGGNSKVPFSVNDRVDNPVSLYAATKRSNELLSESYASLYDLKQIGLRFFTVYGPWGRPDMAPWLFTDAILNKRPIKVFNHGDMYRDFTYIDDIVNGVLACHSGAEKIVSHKHPHRIYNIGNNTPEKLTYFIETLEDIIGQTAEKELLPMQAGDVYQTYADIDPIKKDFGFIPQTDLKEGLEKFVTWFRNYHQL